MVDLFPFSLLCKVAWINSTICRLQRNKISLENGVCNWFYSCCHIFLESSACECFSCDSSAGRSFKSPPIGRLCCLLWVPASKWFAAALRWLILASISWGLMAEQYRLWLLPHIYNLCWNIRRKQPRLAYCFGKIQSWFIQRHTKLKLTEEL